MAPSRLVCLLVTVLVSSQSSVGDDDVAFPPETKIVGGGEVDIKDFPYQVFLSTSISTCGGVIISDRWVLTAAHCTVGMDTSSITIRVGTNYRDSGGDVYGVEKVVIQPQYLRAGDHDISAVKTSEVIQFNRTLGVDKVLLPELDAAPPSENTTLNVTGWGRNDTDYPDKVPDKLKGAVSKVANFSHCASSCFPRDGNLTLCLLPATGAGCHGDSGGPVTRNNVLFGLVYGGKPPCGKAAWVTSVLAFREWINNVTKV